MVIAAPMNTSEKRQRTRRASTIRSVQIGAMPVSIRTFFVEHIDTPTGQMRVVTDNERRLRAADWDDHEARMQTLLQRHYGAGSIELCKPPRRSAAASALLA